MVSQAEAGQWVSWFVNGQAVHVPVDSVAGRQILTELSAHEASHSRSCGSCGNTFLAGRSDARYCSAACQRRSHRRSQRR